MNDITVLYILTIVITFIYALTITVAKNATKQINKSNKNK